MKFRASKQIFLTPLKWTWFYRNFIVKMRNVFFNPMQKFSPWNSLPLPQIVKNNVSYSLMTSMTMTTSAQNPSTSYGYGE